MTKLALTILMASLSAGYYWNSPEYESFVVNPNNRLNPHPVPYYYTRIPGVPEKDHCYECAEIRKGKKLTVSEIKEVLKRHVMDENNLAPKGYSPPPYFVTK